MIREAVFSDETDSYIAPSEPSMGENIRIRLRTAKDDVEKVFLINYEDGEPLEMLMKKVCCNRYFDYYEINIILDREELLYVFKLENGEEMLYYDKLGAGTEIRNAYFFRLIAGYKTPDWAKGAIMYQIFVDRFCRGDEKNDVLDDEYIYIDIPTRHISDWHEYPSAFDVGYFYGGDLQGVLNKLDYLEELGVEAIYFNPLFVSPSNHKYDAQDYEHIDPHYGKIVKDGGSVLPETAQNNSRADKYCIRTTDEANLKASDDFFAFFIREAHKKGIKVIIDGVFNHCGSFHKWLDREGIYKMTGKYPPGAYEGKKSPYRDYFRFYGGEDSKSYDGWWGHDTLPKLFYENSEKLCNKIMEIARKWVMPPYCADGWRLDVAADLGHSPEFNHLFWKRFRENVKEVNPEAVIIAEHYGDPSAWLNGKQWDTVMNYDAFMEPVSWFLTGMEKHSDWKDDSKRGDAWYFFDMLLRNKAKMPMPSYMTAMNELSNHDHSRFLTRTNSLVGRLQTMGSRAAEDGVRLSVFRQAILMQMTMQGAPTIYYGDEVGVCGWTDPDNRRTYPWGNENFELLEYHKYMNDIHKDYKALRLGSFIPVLAQKDVLAYARAYNEECMLIVVFTGDYDTEIYVPAWLAGFLPENKIKRIMYTYEDGYNVGSMEYTMKDRHLSIKTGKNSAMLFAAY